jgi:hypothetical protein
VYQRLPEQSGVPKCYVEGFLETYESVHRGAHTITTGPENRQVRT